MARACWGIAELIEQDDLSLPHNLETVAAREKMAADKRNEDPLLFATHPDFVTFAPDGPLRQISIPQTRLLKERAQYLPHKGSRRVFLIDHVDRANEQAANSLLKTLEEPPDHLILIMTAENAYDLLPTIRSRAVPFYFAPLGARGDAAPSCARARPGPAGAADRAGGGQSGSRHVARPGGVRQAPRGHAGAAEGGGGRGAVRAWVPVAEAIGRSKSEKLELYLKVLYELLRDLLLLHAGHGRDSQSGYPPRTGSAGGESRSSRGSARR